MKRGLGIRASANVVEPREQPDDQVRFGATVTVRTRGGDHAGEQRRFKIVGVDEADPARGRVAFIAPMARAVIGRAPGDIASLRTARGEDELEVVAVE